MEFSTKDLEGSRKEIEVTIPPQEIDQRQEEALALFQKEVSAPGFRPGHVPKDMVKDSVSPEQVFSKAVELSLQKAWLQIREEQNLQVLGEPQVQIMKAAPGNPLVARIVVSLFPEITLPNYKDIASAVEKKEVQVGKEELDKTLQWLAESRKKEDGSIAELTDEFAKGLGRFSGLEELKKSVQKGLLLEKQGHEKNRVRQEIVANIAKETNFNVPEVLVQREQESMLEQTKQGVKSMMGKEFSEYLESIKKTEEEVKESLLQQATDRIRQFLVLDAIAKKEQIVPTKEEVQKEVELLEAQQKPGESQLDQKELALYSEGVLRNEKTLQFLEDLAK